MANAGKYSIHGACGIIIIGKLVTASVVQVNKKQQIFARKLMNEELPMWILQFYGRGIIYTATTFKYVEGGPDREASEVVWNTSSYI